MVILLKKDTKEYYFSYTESCSKCRKRFNPNDVGLIRIFPRLGRLIFCERCISGIKTPPEQTFQQFMGTATNQIVKNSVVISEKRLDFEDYKGGVLATDISQIGGKTTDRTRYAKTGGMNMELPERKPLLELDMEKDQELSDQKMIEMLSQSKPVPKDFNLLDHVVPNQNALDYKKQKQIWMREDK